MDGVLVVDKPDGLTSHDVVAMARRALGEKRIGHTGTLDPMATGVLPLACGRATRLVRFLTASAKDYEAIIRFGLSTDTYDMAGEETSRTGGEPPREAVLAGLDALSGQYLQMPPDYSAKKVNGRRAYDLARHNEAVTLTPVPVTVSRVDLKEFSGSLATVTLTCSAGFYVRSFASSLGQLVGTGACLAGLRRTRSGDFGLDGAVSLDALDADERLDEWLIPMEELLPAVPAVQLTGEGLLRVSHGRQIEASHTVSSGPLDTPEWVRLLDTAGTLVAMATRGTAPGSLHPSVVLI